MKCCCVIIPGAATRAARRLLLPTDGSATTHVGLRQLQMIVYIKNVNGRGRGVCRSV